MIDPQAKQLQDKVRMDLEPAKQLQQVERLSRYTHNQPGRISSVDLASGYDAVPLIGAVMYTAINYSLSHPWYQLAKLSTFGAKKYSLHPDSPHSWRTLPVSSLRDSLLRHLAKIKTGEPHTEAIDETCTSCDLQHVGVTYTGTHEVAVLWAAIRIMWMMERDASA